MITAIANRKGGVGKSTVTCMLAHVYASEGRRVLVIDLDSQANASMLLLGAERHMEVKDAGQTVDHFLMEAIGGKRDFEGYIQDDAGDVRAPRQKERSSMSVVASYDALEQAEADAKLALARTATDYDVYQNKISDMFQQAIEKLRPRYEQIIIDCPPGMTATMLAAIRSADHVIVPYMPDHLALNGVSRVVAEMLGVEAEERQRRLLDIVRLRRDDRAKRYHALPNMVQKSDFAVTAMAEVARHHPQFDFYVPLSRSIADGFRWRAEAVTLTEKYGVEGRKACESLFQAVNRVERRIAA